MEEILDEKATPLLSATSTPVDPQCEQSATEEEGVPFSAIQKAAYLVDQALARHLVPLEVLQHRSYSKAKHAYAVYNSLFYARCVSMMVLTFIPVFEEPEWCRRNMPNHCDEPEKYLLSGIRYLHPFMSTSVKFMCILPLAVSLLLQHYYMFLTFWEDWATWIKVGLLAAMGVHLLTSVPHVPWLFISESRPIGMYLCTLIPIIFSRSLRNCFRMTICIGHSIVDTGGVLIAFILISAWLANKLFHNTNFRDFPTSLLSLFVMLTSANNPNVWVETYEQNHYSFFFFFTYMLVAFFFLMQLLFALIYNNYKVQLAIEVQRHILTRSKNLRAAFDLLNLHRDGISFDNANTLFFQIGSYRHVHDLGAIVEQILVDVKENGDEKIIFGDFQCLCANFVRAIEVKLHNRARGSPEQSRLAFYCSEDLLESGGYMLVSFTATLASVLVALLDHNIRGSESPDISHSEFSKFMPSVKTLTTCEFLLGWLFVIDLAFRMHVRGVKEFFHSVLNSFDVITTSLIISLQISTIWYPKAFDWISVSIVVRSMRYFSLLGYFRRWRFMGRLLIAMVPATAPILGFQLLVCSLFSVVGVHVFGGLVFAGNPRLDATEYASSGLWVYNYNDFGSAMVTSFNLCVVNNWYVIMDGYVAATGSQWSRSYFIVFWAIAVTFTLNVVVAFFVGAFTTQMERAEHAHSLYTLAPPSSKRSVLARRKLGTSLFMGYTGAFSKYDLYEEIVRR